MKKIVVYSAILLAGVVLGKIVFGGHETHDHESAKEVVTEWTCSMHPQIRKDKPGQCPICGMDLVPVQSLQGGLSPDAVVLTAEAIALAHVETIKVGESTDGAVIALNGKVVVNETKQYSQSSHLAGRIEKLIVNVTGEKVSAGQTLAILYSPELSAAAQELREVSKIKATQPSLYDAARARLANWKLTNAQIDNLEKNAQASTTVDVHADRSGIVIAKKVNVGDYVMAGTVLYDVADLSDVWVQLDAYEKDLHSIDIGSKVELSTPSLAGKAISGKVAFVDPVIDPATRVARVRVAVRNIDQQLKPDMIVKATVIHERSAGKALVVPRSAVLWTGERSVVYLEEGDHGFVMRDVELGPLTAQGYAVTSGIAAGDVIVVNGVFAVDAAAQLSGKPSMMNSSIGTGVDPADNFQADLRHVFDAYIKLKDALVSSDNAAVVKAAAVLSSAVNNVREVGRDQNIARQWMELKHALLTSLEQMTKDLEQNRKTFATLSIRYHEGMKLLPLSGTKVFYQFCPMAGTDGSYWLSQTKEIRNPYFGSAMLTCGETKEEMPVITANSNQ